MPGKLRDAVRDSLEEGFLSRVREKFYHDCERCPCAWEDWSYEGDCDCGCLLYRDMDARHAGCWLPDSVLRLYTRWKRARLDEAEAAAYEDVAVWYAESELRDQLFRRALYEKLYTDFSGNPAAPLRKSGDGGFWAYESQDGFAMARMDYEENLDAGMPRIKAFQKAVADRLCTDLYFLDGERHEAIRLFANSGNAVERYHEMLREHGLELPGL